MFQILPNWHPIFVHFSVALLSVAAVLHLASHFVSQPVLANQWAIVARWNLWIGIGVTVLTVAAGWYAYNTVDHDTPSHAAMTEHRNWAMVTFIVFLGIAAWEYYLHRRGKNKGWLFTALLLVAALLLLSTAWHGGELVYRYGLGVKALPKVEGEGHAHEHGDAHTHSRDEETMSPEPEHHDIDSHHHDEPAAGNPEATPHPHSTGTPPHQN